MSLNTSRNQDDEKAEIVTLESATNDDDSDDYNYHDSDIDNSNESSAAASTAAGSPAREVNSKQQKSGGSSHDIEYAWRIQLDLRRVGKYRNHVYNRIKKVLNYYGFEKYSSNGNGPIYYRNDDIINHYDNRDDIKDDFIKPILFSQLMIRKIQTQIDDINDEALNKLIENENEKGKAKQNEKDNNNNNNNNNNSNNNNKKKKGNNEKIRQSFEKTMLVRYQIFYHGHYGDLSISWTAPIGNHYLKKIENNARNGTACQQNNCHSNPNNNNNHNNNNDDDDSGSDSKPPKKNKDDANKTKKKRSMVGCGDYSASDEESVNGTDNEYDSHDDMHPEMSNLKRKNSMCKDNNNNNNNNSINNNSSKNSKKTDINKKDNVKNILNTTNQNNELDELSSEFSSATATDNDSDNDEDDTGVDSVKKQLSFRKRN